MNAILHSWFLTVRLLRHLMRQPWYIVFTLAQPIVWMLLYGPLFRSVAMLPGFNGSSYITFLTPGIIVMSALVSASWSGVGLISDLDSGIVDRFLVSPVSRSAIVFSRLITLAINIILQCAILSGLGVILGARYSRGIGGFPVLFYVAILIGVFFGGLSTALALSVRKQESVIGAMNFILLPVIFLSGTLMTTSLTPKWMQKAVLINPVNWADDAARGALQANVPWPGVIVRLLALMGLAVLSCWLATSAFRGYQRSA
jgi:ABC-2 type transport system permease protein